MKQTIDNFIQAINAKHGTTPYDTEAQVVRVEGSTVWVHIPDGVDETPIKKTIEAKKGDIVQVRVSGGRAWLTGNLTAPPSDDSKAIRAQEIANQAFLKSNRAETQVKEAFATDTMHYLATPIGSGVTTETAGWTTTIQTITETNKYLWTYHTYTKIDGTSFDTTPVITGTFGQKGDDGTSVTILGSYDTLAELEAAHPTGELGDAYMVSGDLYVWNGSEWENVGQIQGPQGPQGETGDTGVSITAVQPQYGLSTSTTVAPSTWSTSLTYETGKYIWTREQISYSDNTTGYSTAIYNQALTQACSDAMQALEVAQEVNQYTWHTETDTGAGAGTHITMIPQDDFLDDPDNGGFNSLWDSLGMKIRDGLKVVASYGAKLILGESDSARVEIDPALVDVISDTGESALKVETTSTKQTVLTTERGATEPYFWIDGDTGWTRTQIFFRAKGPFLAVAGSTIALTVYLGDTTGKYYTRYFVAGTDSYVDIGHYRITYTYDAGSHACHFDLSGSSIDTSLDAYIISIQYYINDYVPNNTLYGVNSINGIIKLNDVDVFSPTLENDSSLTPVSSRCVITSGGVFKFGKWRFVQLELTIKTSLSANNTWGLLSGFDLPVTGSKCALAASVQKNYGNVSANIATTGNLVVQTGGTALANNDVLVVTGWYIAS